MMNYDEIKRMLSKENLCRLIPDGLILSEPILGIGDDLPVVNFFVMSRSQQKYHPLYKFSLSVEKKQLVTFSEYLVIAIVSIITALIKRNKKK